MLTKAVAILFAIFYALTGTPLTNYDYSEKASAGEYTGLREYYAEDYFDVGAAVGSGHITNSEYSVPILKNFSSLTPENDLKQPIIHPAEGVWNFGGADCIADFCRENGLKMRGHCLVWGNLDNWMLYDENGDFVSKEVYYARLKEHIEVLMHRYGDVVSAWDVVNEPFGYDRSSVFKHSAIYDLCGEEYITKAYEFANQADPNAVLVLNETGITRNNVKTRYLLENVQRWLDAGVPIHAIGLQGHWDLFNPSETPRRMERVIRKLAAMGVDVQITEVDINVYATKNPKLQKAFDVLPTTVERIQNKRYHDLFKMLRENAQYISSVTFWAVSDKTSFYNAYEPSNPDKLHNFPTLFDMEGKPKQAYFAAVDF